MSGDREHVPYGCGVDVAPYVLGALTDEEHESFVDHLRTCAECREQVASLQAVARALPAAAPQLTAPAPLRDRVMGTVRAEAGLRSAASGAEPRVRRPRRARSPHLPWWLVAGSAAATAIVVALAVMVFGGGGAAGTQVYRAQVSARAAKATLRVRSGQGTLQIANLPQTAPGKVYEVWVKRAGAPQPTDALFTVSAAGDATVDVPGNLGGVKVVMVTAEPKGGSRVPTGAPVIVANLS